MSTSNGCVYEVAFRGPCGKPIVDRSMCAQHAPMKCASCLAPAIRECDASVGVVCGYPLCGGCGHSLTGKHVPQVDVERDFLQWRIDGEQRNVDRANEKIAKANERIADLRKRMEDVR